MSARTIRRGATTGIRLFVGSGEAGSKPLSAPGHYPSVTHTPHSPAGIKWYATSRYSALDAMVRVRSIGLPQAGHEFVVIRLSPPMVAILDFSRKIAP